MRLLRRFLVPFTILVAFSLPGSAAEPLTLALSKTPLSLPFFVAEQEGYFAAEGVSIKINEVIGGHRSLQQVLDGNADLGTCSEAVVMFNSFKRDDFAILASFVSSAEDVKLVAHPRSGIENAAHLSQKRVGTIVGSASHYYLTTLAVLNGVDPKSIKIVSLQPEAMANALAQGQVDAIASWQPSAYLSERAVPGAKVVADSGFYNVFFNLVVARNLIGRRDEDLARVLRALDRAQRHIATKPAAARELLKSRLALDSAYIEWIWPRYRYQLTLDQSLLTTLENEARWARREGLVTAAKSPNYLHFLHAAPLRRVLPASVSISE